MTKGSAYMRPLNKYNDKQMKTMSMIDLAYDVLLMRKEALHFIDLFDDVADFKQLSSASRKKRLAQFYTDLNVDGRFTPIRSNVWGLKRWYSVKKTNERLLTEANMREQEDNYSINDEEEMEQEFYDENQNDNEQYEID